jgi:hypothetical protein
LTGRIETELSNSPTGDQQPEVADDSSPAVAAFDDILSSSRVYSRFEDNEVDGYSTLQTTRSRSWSVFSGASLSQISVIAVVHLPLHEAELERFQALVNSSNIVNLASTVSLLEKDASHDRKWLIYNGVIHPNWDSSPQYGTFRRIAKELRDIVSDPPPLCAASPKGDDLVSF